VGAEDLGCGLLERGKVECEAACPDVGGKHGGADDIAGEDAVLVGFAEGAVAGVEVGGCEFDGEDTDARGESTVEGAVEVGAGDGDGEREGRYLSEGVDAGVGAAGALGEHGFAGDVMNHVGEGALDGRQVGLNLPAVEGGSIVAEGYLPVRHEVALDGITEEPASPGDEKAFAGEARRANRSLLMITAQG
jgi:hypothetical protein